MFCQKQVYNIRSYDPNKLNTAEDTLSQLSRDYPNIASFPHFYRDENPLEMKNLSAMRLVNFVFFPHYKNSKNYEAELLHHSKKSKRPL